MKVGDFGADFRFLRVALGAFRQVGAFLVHAHLDIAAELNVGAAAGHIGRDRDRARHARFGDDIGFLFVEARVEHGEEFRRLARARGGIKLCQRLRLGEVDLPIALRDEIIGELFGFFDRGRADEHRLQFRIGGLDLGDDRGKLFFVGAIDLVVLVEALHRHIRRNLDDVELVDLGEFVGFGRRRAGHAGELLIKTEIILEGDRGERHVLRLHRDMFFGFERLMQAFRIAPARHHAAGEFVDDDDFVVADDIVLVALEQFVRAHRLIDVMDDRHIDRIVKRSVFVDQAGGGEQFFDVLIAVFRQIDGALLFVDVVIFRRADAERACRSCCRDRTCRRRGRR